MIKKVTPHLSQNEALLFERSSPGKKAYQLPDLDVEACKLAALVDEVKGRVGAFSANPHYLVLGERAGETSDGQYCRGRCEVYKSPGDTHFHFLPVLILLLARLRLGRAVEWLQWLPLSLRLGGKESNDGNLCLRILKPKDGVRLALCWEYSLS